MKIKNVDTTATLEFNYGELLMLNNALNEICNGIDVFEFETRVGVSRDAVRMLLKEIQMVVERIEKPMQVRA